MIRCNKVNFRLGDLTHKWGAWDPRVQGHSVRDPIVECLRHAARARSTDDDHDSLEPGAVDKRCNCLERRENGLLNSTSVQRWPVEQTDAAVVVDV